jgi:hypothetical protein
MARKEVKTRHESVEKRHEERPWMEMKGKYSDDRVVV